MYAQALVGGKYELYLDHQCQKPEGTVFPDAYELLSFCHTRRLALVPLGLGRVYLIPVRELEANRRKYARGVTP